MCFCFSFHFAFYIQNDKDDACRGTSTLGLEWRELAAALARRDADALLSLGGQLSLQSLALSSMRLALAPDPSSLSFSNNLVGGCFLQQIPV